MNRDGRIPGYGGKFYSYKIESADVAGIQRECRGFIHGGKMVYLPDILIGSEAGGHQDYSLKCSNILRREGAGFRSRDNTDVLPNGEGVYCRFIPVEERVGRLVKSITGPGASGGFFVCISTQDAVELSFYTMDSNDMKYGQVNGKDARERGLDESQALAGRMCETVREVRRQVSRNGVNNSEIAFYRNIPLQKVGEVFLLKNVKPKNQAMWNVNDASYVKAYREVYNDSPQFKISRKPSCKDMLDLFGILLQRRGFIYTEDFLVKQHGNSYTYQRYIRPSHNLFPLRAAPSMPAHASEPSVPSTHVDSSIL
ncbi:MAG: hypothetical protein HFH82_16985 [Lachnospiraceae bacterium]|nr:hypothetical protein [Lachnospiraceae bacterium]